MQSPTNSSPQIIDLLDYVDKFWLIMAGDTHCQNSGSAPEYSLN